jgi:hypothetical protein
MVWCITKPCTFLPSFTLIAGVANNRSSASQALRSVPSVIYSAYMSRLADELGDSRGYKASGALRCIG